MGRLATIKTRQTSASVADFIDSIPNEQQRNDSRVILQLMENATAGQPKTWGTALIGFGHLRYKSPATGREVDWLK